MPTLINDINMRTNEEKRKFKELDIKEKASLAKARLLDPECSQRDFARKHNIEVGVIKTIENRINFDENTAVGELMWRVLSKDNELIELASDMNVAYVKQTAEKKTLNGKEVEVVDKLVNTAMKRAAVIASMKEKEEGGDGIDVVINF